MSAEKKISLQDNFAITADLVALDVVAKKAKAWGVLVTVAVREQLRQQMQPVGNTIYVIVDLSDSAGQTASQAAHMLTEIVNRIDLFKSRMLIYPMGKNTALELSAVEANAQLQRFSRENGAETYRRGGTFIDPALQAIQQDAQSRRSDESPVLLIFSDAEVWDWELYRDFLKGHENFRAGFLEVGGQHLQNKIVEQVRLVNKQHAVFNAKTTTELLDNVLSAPAASPAVIDDVSLRISFDQHEPFGVMDIREKRLLEHDGNQFKWQSREGVLPATFFQRLYLFCPGKPERLRLRGQASMLSEGQVMNEEITVQFNARAKALTEALPQEDERKHCLQLVEQKCVAAWQWKQDLIEVLLQSIQRNENLPKAPFHLDCPNTEKKSCGVHNKAEEWIFRPEPSALCWNCRQVLLHVSKLEATDPKLHGANILLLAIEFFPTTNAIEIGDEPIGFNSREAQALEIGNFKVYGHGQAAVLRDRLQHYRLAAVDGEFKYESAIVQTNAELQLSSFDFVKPLFEDSTAPETYYLFLDISKLI